LNGRKLLENAAENWFAKVASIFVAIILFVFHRVSALEERFISVPLTVRSANNLIPANSHPRIVRVSLRGESSSIFIITDSDIEVYVDLSSYTEPGSYQVPVVINKMGAALGIEPLELRVDPMEISLELDYRERRMVSITPSFGGTPERGYELASYTLEPSQIEIVGPRRRLAEINDLSTDYIEIQGRSANFNAQAHILNRDPLIVMQGSGVVEVKVLIRDTVIRRSFEKVPVEMRELNSRFSYGDVEPYGSVTLSGNQNALEKLILPAGVLYADCSRITQPGSYTLPVRAEAPQPFEAAAFEPESVDVEILVRR
jgi:YbbR domain-containing protein